MTFYYRLRTPSPFPPCSQEGIAPQEAMFNISTGIVAYFHKTSLLCGLNHQKDDL